MSTLSSFVMSLVSPIAKKVMVSLGFSVVSYAAVSTALNGALSAAKGAFGGFVGEVGQILAMAGLFEALSITAAGMTAAVTLTALKKLEIR